MSEADVLEVHAEKVRFACMCWLSAHAVKDAVSLRVIVDPTMEGLMVQLRDFVLAIPEDRIEIQRRYPRDWWQAFRERWFPRWWLSRRPVDYEEIDIDEPKFGPVCPHSAAVPFKEHIGFLASEQIRAAHGTESPRHEAD
jgi:hypothetical protein